MENIDNKKVQIDKRQSARATLMLLAIFFYIGGLILIGFGVKYVTDLNESNIVSTISTISDIKYDEENTNTIITTDNQTYTLPNDFVTYEKISTTLAKNETYEFSYSLKYSAYGKNNVIKITQNNEVLVDVYNDYVIDSYSMVGVGGGIILLGLINNTIWMILRRKPKIENYSVIDVFLLTNYVSNNVTKKESRPLPRSFIFISIVIFMLLQIGLLSLLVVLINIDEKIGAISILPFVISSIALSTLYVFFINKPFKKKDVPLFVEHYKDFLENHSLKEFYKKFELKNFNDEGFLVYTEPENKYEEPRFKELIPYSSLHLYTIVQYRKMYNSCNIYIISEENVDEGYPVLVMVSPELYQLLKRNNVEVDGLDYVMNHLEDEINQHVDKNIKYVIYKNGTKEVKLINKSLIKYVMKK
jgi:hypothetical protein